MNKPLMQSRAITSIHLTNHIHQAHDQLRTGLMMQKARMVFAIPEYCLPTGLRSLREQVDQTSFVTDIEY